MKGTTTAGALRVECPEVCILGSAWDQIRSYVQAVDSEVGGLGLVKLDFNRLLVTRVFLLDQEVTSNTTDMDAEAVAKLVFELVGKGEDVGNLRFWWHSHHDMETFWSRQDVSTMEGLAKNGYCLSMVTNRREKMLARLSLGGVVPVSVDNLPVRVVRSIPHSIRRTTGEEVLRKVRRRSYLSEAVSEIVFGSRESSSSPQEDSILTRLVPGDKAKGGFGE